MKNYNRLFKQWVGLLFFIFFLFVGFNRYNFSSLLVLEKGEKNKGRAYYIEKGHQVGHLPVIYAFNFSLSFLVLIMDYAS